MSKLARKINRVKWDVVPELHPDEIAADAASSDLRTADNRLSFWECVDVDDELDLVYLAMAANNDRVDKMDVVWIDHSEVANAGITMERIPGETPVAIAREKHVDLSKLDLDRLATVGKMLGARVRAGDCKPKTRQQIIDLLVKAVNNAHLKLDDLHPNLRDIVRSATSAKA